MSNLAKNTFILVIATVLAKILGFFREMVLASTYGAGMVTDSYITALNIPSVLFVAIGAAVASTFIPIYFDIKSKHDESEAIKFTNNVINIIILLCILISIVGLIFTKPLVKVFAAGFTGEKLELTIRYTRVLILGMASMGVSGMITAFLQSKDDFTIPGLIGLPYNIIIISSIILSAMYNPNILIWGTLFGIISQLIFQIPFAYKKGFKYELYIDLKDKYLKRMILLLGPVFIGVAVNQLNSIVDRSLASTINEGTVSILNYANKLNSVIIVMFISTLTSVIYPMLAKLAHDKKKDEFNKMVVKGINSIVLLVLPISIGAMTLSQPIIKVLFERGEFNTNATLMTSQALLFYAIGMVPYGITDLLSKVFYTLQDTKTPVVNASLSMIANIVLNFILIRSMSHNGLAFATSIASYIYMILLFRKLTKVLGNFGQKKVYITVFKSLCSALVMAIATRYSYEILLSNLVLGMFTEYLVLACSILVGGLVYATMIVILRVEEVSTIINMVKDKVGNKLNKNNTFKNIN
ncbi:murein biosynthesis integral membrane protein MurJ [Terrisporobacter sp.]|uniref:murein biosynthesis integral membrane protein MurJ n=1 Tax=Terrisporobacter sp. TaxID=1965305 RepID=UPI00261915F3|nr:murein biosynthesis integral membrane protein MurJ [Terrisporobacter sp.]